MKLETYNKTDWIREYPVLQLHIAERAVGLGYEITVKPLAQGTVISFL
jgi:hypothetical protein